MCGREIIWPTDGAILDIKTNGNETIESINVSVEAKKVNSQEKLDSSEVAYEVIEYELDSTVCKTDCPNMVSIETLVGVNSYNCRENCFTNGKQNFQGHEVEGKSIRCSYEANASLDNGGE